MTELSIGNLLKTYGKHLGLRGVVTRLLEDGDAKATELQTVVEDLEREAITDGLRGELKPFGVRVTLIRPGFILTEFVDAADAASTGIMENAGPYTPYLGGFRVGYDRLRRIAGTPDDIARLVERALTADNPAARYSGPFHAKIFLLLKWLLPDAVFSFITRLRK